MQTHGIWVASSYSRLCDKVYWWGTPYDFGPGIAVEVVDKTRVQGRKCGPSGERVLEFWVTPQPAIV